MILTTTDLDLIEAAREEAVARLPILRLLAAGEEAIGREVLFRV